MAQPSALSDERVSGNEGLVPPAGALDGVTIMRYAHIYRERTSGGVEQYLRLLNRGLLQRNRATILQMHLTRDGAGDAIEEERVGMGRVLWVPVATQKMNSRLTGLTRQMKKVCDEVRHRRREEKSGRYSMRHSFLHSLWLHSAALLRYKWAVLSDRLSLLLRTRSVDLLALHWLTYDTDALISSAERAGIPFVLINHFENARFEVPQMRKWTARAAGIGGVSDQGVPDALRSRYVNLSDAIDTEFFTPRGTRPVAPPPRRVILLPGRIEAGKGHRDMMEAARILNARKIDFQLCFAGAVESESLRQELSGSIAAACLLERVSFLGEVSAEEMRDLYAQSSLVVLPSYSEGLPRVLLEAQAMEKPVVAYNCGGMGESLLPNETGFLVGKGNVKELASKAGLLLRDEARRLRMGDLGRKFVARRFGLPALVERHERFYLSALLAGAARRV